MKWCSAGCCATGGSGPTSRWPRPPWSLATWPFVRPYLQLREQTGLGVRSREEIAMFSADTHAFATIAPNSQTLAETFSGFPKPEGEGFVGLTILAFAIVGLGCGIVRIVRTLPWAHDARMAA